MKLDIKTIEELAKNVQEYGIESFQLDLGNEKLSLRAKGDSTTNVAVLKQEIIPDIKEEELDLLKEEGKMIVSPMAGTVYRAAAPGKEAFVKLGDMIHKGDTLCIVEAMKMMNDVKSTEEGTLVKIFVEDGVVVTKGQVLFEIK